MQIGDYPLYFKICNYGDDIELDAEPFSYSCLVIRKEVHDDAGNIASISEFSNAICNDICCSDCILQPQCVTAKQGQAKSITDYIRYNYPDEFI